MAIRGMPLIPSMVTKTLLCVDKAEEHEVSGRIYNPYMERCMEFSSSKQILDIMEDFFDRISFPQAYFTTRSFEYKKRSKERKPDPEIVRHFEDTVFEENKGEIASLIMTVQFRHRAEWQGVLEWVEEGESCKFGSTLELFRLLEQAVEGTTGKPLFDGWGGKPQ